MNDPASITGESTTGRIHSIDALRGLVMFVMIVVNDLSDVPNTIVPWWMKHFRGPNGMTFVDLVFPAFLFIVGMSIPFALQSRTNKGESRGRTFLHVLVRTLSLLFIGIMMVNGTPDSEKMGWSGSLWCTLMYFSAICAFSVFPPKRKILRVLSFFARGFGLAGLVILAFVFQNKNGHPIISLSPFYIRHIWYGILGYIGWAYLLSGIAFLIFGTNRVALLGCMVLMMCLYPANKQGMLNGLWIAGQVNIGVAFGSRAAIAAAGLLLGAMLLSTARRDVLPRVRFTLLLTAGCAAAAWLLAGLYGISKEEATPSWSLWGCVATSIFWLIFYFISDVRPVRFISRPLAMAGENVLLAYLISEMLPSLLETTGLDNWYGGRAQPALANALCRSVICSLVILSLASGLNRLGLRLKL